jgi:hypothetical protein
VNEQGEWQLEAYIKASDPVPGDHFGAGVALSRDGDTLIVSAPDKPSDPLPQGGEGTGILCVVPVPCMFFAARAPSGLRNRSSGP